MKKRKSTTIILVIIFLVGFCVLLYPAVSNYVNSRNCAKAIDEYDENVANLQEEEKEQMLADAKAYNKKIAKSKTNFINGDPSDEEYKSLLDVNGDGMMGYITITKIDVRLPIYHGTGEDALVHSVGHIEGSSLPIGGKSTHTVISGHRGLPSATLFSNLDKLEVGDTFVITVLGEKLTYEVDQIRVVLPDEVSELDVVEGKDYVTLVTCTPYGINTHRLLVRGHRIASDEALDVASDALQIDTKLVAVVISIPILLVLIIWVLVHYRTKNKKKRKSK
jgi:sortase A